MNSVLEIVFKPIGVIHTPFIEKEKTPIQSARSETLGTVEVFESYLDGLDGVEGFSHLILLYAFDRSPLQSPLKVKPFLDDQLHGVFATRYPNRPNALGLSVVRLVERKDNILSIMGVDMLDGTPLLDIKPYVPEFDIHEVSKTGWYANRAHP
jgi:tRNA (adenine37-N6)-methyltransferase